MDRNPKHLYSLTALQFTKLAEQRTHDRETQQAFEKFTVIVNQGCRTRVLLCGFSDFSILDENVPADSKLLKIYGKTAIRYRLY